jgi:hypothetical protein
MVRINCKFLVKNNKIHDISLEAAKMKKRENKKT